MASLLIQAALCFAVHEDGTLEILCPWWPLVLFTLEALAAADGRRLALRGDELTIRCTNGGATYALGPINERLGIRGASLLRSW